MMPSRYTAQMSLDDAKEQAEILGVDGVYRELRHSFISLMLSRGVSVEVVGQWVGHLDRNTTATVYNHFLKTESVSVMAKLRLFEAV